MSDQPGTGPDAGSAAPSAGGPAEGPVEGSPAGWGTPQPENPWRPPEPGAAAYAAGPPGPPPAPPVPTAAPPYAPPPYGPAGYAGSYGPGYAGYGWGPPPAGYGWGPPGYPYPPRPGPSGSTIALTIVAALLTMSCYFTIAGLPSLVMAILALVRNDQDPEGARRLTRNGWIVMGVVSVVILILIVVFAAVLFSVSATETGFDDTDSI